MNLDLMALEGASPTGLAEAVLMVLAGVNLTVPVEDSPTGPAVGNLMAPMGGSHMDPTVGNPSRETEREGWTHIPLSPIHSKRVVPSGNSLIKRGIDTSIQRLYPVNRTHSEI